MLKRENFNMLGKLGVIVLGMFWFGYALVPIYRGISSLKNALCRCIRES